MKMTVGPGGFAGLYTYLSLCRGNLGSAEYTPLLSGPYGVGENTPMDTLRAPKAWLLVFSYP